MYKWKWKQYIAQAIYSRWGNGGTMVILYIMELDSFY